MIGALVALFVVLFVVGVPATPLVLRGRQHRRRERSLEHIASLERQLGINQPEPAPVSANYSQIWAPDKTGALIPHPRPNYSPAVAASSAPMYMFGPGERWLVGHGESVRIIAPSGEEMTLH